MNNSPKGTLMARMVTPMSFLMISSFRKRSLRPFTCSRFRLRECTGYHIMAKLMGMSSVAA